MAHDDQDDLFVEDFDFLDEDETEEKTEEKAEKEPDSEAPAKPKRRTSRGGKRGPKREAEPEVAKEKEKAKSSETVASETASETAAETTAEKETTEEPKEPPVPTDHVIHIYEHGEFTRTIAREFTSDDAEAFAVEYNRTSGAHGRQSVAAGKDDKPAEAL